MIDELYGLLQRQLGAVEALEARLRALELLVAADERRFVALALDELETAADALAALELTRSLALAAAGIDPDVRARELLAGLQEEADRALLGGVVEQLRAATARVDEARERTRSLVGRSAVALRARIEVADRLAAV